MSAIYLWTLIPFTLFLFLMLWHERKHNKREASLRTETDRYMRPLAKTTQSMFKRQYGHPSSEIENTFPEIKPPQ